MARQRDLCRAIFVYILGVLCEITFLYPYFVPNCFYLIACSVRMLIFVK